MNVLIVHQNFPGQFPHIAMALRQRGDKVAVVGSKTAKAAPGFDVRRWTLNRGSTPGIFVDATRAEADLLRAHAAAKVMQQLADDGFTPDVVIGHPGWGETLHVKEIWPATKLIVLGEMFYRSSGSDSGFDPEFKPKLGASDVEERLRVNSKGAVMALACAMADLIICPTAFQASSFPESLRANLRVLHEGLDLDRARRKTDARVALPDGGILDASKPVITFVSRVLEPLRGFHIFMRALPALLDTCPKAQVAIVGQDKPSGYGKPSPNNAGWKAALLAELNDRIDLSRVHFLGQIPHPALIDLFSISTAHVYYTYPFVLSWSLVEAMACECLVLASDTAPLHDAIVPGENGILNDFFDVSALSNGMIEAVRAPSRFAETRQAARATALARFDSKVGVKGWLALIDEVGISADRIDPS